MVATPTARAKLARILPEFKIVKVEWLSLFAYPLSGGFQPWSLLAGAMVSPLLQAEARMLPILGRSLAFRLHIVLERV
jgi:hypothetical protein